MKTHNKLIIVIIFIILVSNSFLGIVNYIDSKKFATDILIEKNYDELDNIREYYFDKLIKDMEYIVTHWSENDFILQYDKAESLPRIVDYIPNDFYSIYVKWMGMTNSSRDITWMYYALESDGSIYIAPIDESMPHDYDARSREWYKGTVEKEGQIFWTDPYVDAGNSGKILQTVSKAVYKDDQLKGVVALDIELTKFTNIINNLSYSKNSLVFLVNQNGDILAHNSNDVIKYQSEFLSQIDPNSNSKVVDINSNNYLLSWVPLAINDWKLVSVTETHFEKNLDLIKQRILLIVLCTVTLGVIASFVLSKNVMKPLQQLVEVTNSVSEGNFTVRVKNKSDDEFGHLGNSFNHMLNHLEHLMKELDDNYKHTVKLLANAIEASDHYTRGHCDRVGKIAMQIAQAMNLNTDDKNALELACILHDIGKIGVPERILNKPSSLTDDEFDIIKKHPEIGFNIVNEIDFLSHPAQIILQHHERIDGKGYPHQLKGSQIRIEAKILAVADVYDAMTSFRVYKSKIFTSQQVRDELIRVRDTQLDSCTVEALLSLIDNGDISI